MSTVAPSPLEFCLLGLLHRAPMSGYDVRKILVDTPMRRFSDSPGSIYPALRRLQRKRWLRSRRDAKSRRRRSEFEMTPAGRQQLREWLMRKLTHDDVTRRIEEVMLRLAFFDLVADERPIEAYLDEVRKIASEHNERLNEFVGREAAKMPLNARLAIEYGASYFEHLTRWTAEAAMEAAAHKRSKS